MSLKHLFVVACTVVLCSCRHENVQIYPTEFKEYVDEFFYQANLRSHNLVEENLNFVIEFGETPDDASATCTYRGNVITINPNKWERLDHQKKEYLLFHELGHCILDRNHRNDESSTSECYSYMNGTEDNFTCSLNHYSDYWRNYYLDELFDQSTLLPEWYTSNQDYISSYLSFKDSIIITDTIVERFEIDTLRFSDEDKFLLEIEFDNLNTEEHSVLLSLGNLKFSHCDICTGGKTNLRLGNDLLYSSADLDLNAETKLSILRNDDIVSFYVNEFFIHAMEYSIIEGNQLKTNSFDENLKIRMRYLYVE